MLNVSWVSLLQFDSCTGKAEPSKRKFNTVTKPAPTTLKEYLRKTIQLIIITMTANNNNNNLDQCRVGFDPPLNWSGWINKSIPADHNMPFEMIPLKLNLDTKHRLLMLNTCNVDE